MSCLVRITPSIWVMRTLLNLCAPPAWISRQKLPSWAIMPRVYLVCHFAGRAPYRRLKVKAISISFSFPVQEPGLPRQERQDEMTLGTMATDVEQRIDFD